MSAPTKIAELDIPCLAAHNENVFWFYVPMNHVALLAKEQRRYNLLDDFSCDVFVKAADFPEYLVKVAFWNVLQHRINVVTVVKVGI